MSSRIIHFSQSAMPAGLLTGLLMGIGQSLLVALVPLDRNTAFVLLIILILLLYLAVPLFARLHSTRNVERASDEKSAARRIGLTCASLVTVTSIIVFTLSTFNVHVVESGGFLGLRLDVDSFLSLVALILLNAAGLVLSLVGGWLGGVFGAMRARHRARYMEEQG